jgi:hypothetical protein
LYAQVKRKSLAIFFLRALSQFFMTILFGNSLSRKNRKGVSQSFVPYFIGLTNGFYLNSIEDSLFVNRDGFITFEARMGS